MEGRSEYEVVCLNNVSDDDTQHLLSQISSPNFRLVLNDEYLPTSEENVYNGVKHAKGEYIWFLGDDDVPRYDSVAHLMAVLQKDDTDFLVSNFRVTDGEGRLATLSLIRGIADDTKLSLRSLIRRVGLINMLSGWSIIVARRSMLDVKEASRIRAISPIYSHCFWFLSCFGSAQVKLLARPLVDYRVFHHKAGWDSYTEDREVGFFHYWHLGFLRLLQDAVTKGKISYGDINQIYEYRHDGTRYRSVDEIANKLLEQADVYMSTGKPRNLLSRAEFQEARDIIIRIDLKLQDALNILQNLYEALWSDDLRNEHWLSEAFAIRREFFEHLSARQRDLFEPFFRELLYGYIVYEVDEFWIGVREDRSDLIDSVFSQFEPRAARPHILVERTREALVSTIKYAPFHPEPVGVQPVLIDHREDYKKFATVRQVFSGLSPASVPLQETKALREGLSKRSIDGKLRGDGVVRWLARYCRRLLGLADRSLVPADFDAGWYLEKYPEVRSTGLTAYRHYRRFGARQGFFPNPHFDADWYLWRYADVKRAGLDPFSHFRRHGMLEGRDPHPQFDNASYRGWLGARQTDTLGLRRSRN